MAMSDALFIGLMSGTSLDAVDAALVCFEDSRPALLSTHSEPLPDPLRNQVIALNQPGGHDELDRVGQLDRELGVLFAHAVNTLLQQENISPAAIQAIGSHGQTLRHRPPGTLDAPHAFTCQIGDPATIAELTGITTVADFRRRDIAAGGQGAPLAPAFHQAVFAAADEHRAVINIGGMANMTLLTPGSAPQGFDTGPGNVLMDAWHQQHHGRRYDENGHWAASGKVDPGLLQTLLAHPFFSLPPPKSTGRETFNMRWLEAALNRQPRRLAPADVQATLLELTAITIAEGILSTDQAAVIYCCGGGAYNLQLMERLTYRVQPRRLATTAELGLAPEWVEAAAFAWLAHRTLAGLPGNAMEVTGASGPRILGAIHLA